MSSSSFDLAKHLKEEHNISPFQTYLKEIVYGGNDGIVTTFAVVAGFTGANLGNVGGFSFLTVLLFGLANLFADGLSMGLGNFLSIRAEQDVYKAEEAKELHEIRTHPKDEKKETMTILQSKGFTSDQAAKITELYATNEKYWLDFMMQQELEMNNPKNENPVYTGIATFCSFLSFGFIPLIPYLFFANSDNAFLYAAFATFSAMVLLGLLRWKVTKIQVVRSVSEILIIGGAAAITAYLVGTFFKI